MTNDCHNLDAYLDGELSPGESVRFAAHLAGCPACREAVDEQQWIDGLLRAPAIAQLEKPSAALVESFRGALARRSRIARLAGRTSAAAAAVLLVGAGWLVQLNRQAGELRDVGMVAGGIVAPVEVVSTADPSLLARGADVVATFIAGPEVIAVPVESEHPDVTIVRVYPVYELDSTAHASLGQTTLGGEFAWPDLNGG